MPRGSNTTRDLRAYGNLENIAMMKRDLRFNALAGCQQDSAALEYVG
jgi:hypothetical protein